LAFYFLTFYTLTFSHFTTSRPGQLMHTGLISLKADRTTIHNCTAFTTARRHVWSCNYQLSGHLERAVERWNGCAQSAVAVQS